MRSSICGWILVCVSMMVSGCATSEGFHRMAASMGTTVQGPFPLPDDFEFPEIEEVEQNQGCEFDVVPFLELE